MTTNNSIPETLNPNLKRINGPVNVIRLEGEIDSVRKVIYLFMDFHLDVYNQTECDNLFSKDIQKFFIKNFYRLNKSDRVYDFFLEIMPTRLENISYGQNFQIDINYRYGYIYEVMKMFRKMFIYQPKINKVVISDLFKNVRLHYIDIRDYFEHTFFDDFNELLNIAYNFSYQLQPQQLQNIIKILEEGKQYLQFIIDILQSDFTTPPKKVSIIYFKEKDDQKNQEIPSLGDVLKYLLYKLKFGYKNDHIKNIINLIINNFEEKFIDYIKIIENTIKQLMEYQNILFNTKNKLLKNNKSLSGYSYGLPGYIRRDITKNIIDDIEKINVIFLDLMTQFMDIYFLRRFLDKNYITNAIAYTGAGHTLNYIYYLVKEFNFKITHTSYSKNNDLKKLSNEIKQLSSIKEISQITEIFWPPIFNQCSDMTHFPKNFI